LHHAHHATLIFSLSSPILAHAAAPQADSYRGVGNGSSVACRSAWSPFSGVKLAGFEVVISELETELDYLGRATRYLEE
jgi:hypothetical protein